MKFNLLAFLLILCLVRLFGENTSVSISPRDTTDLRTFNELDEDGQQTYLTALYSNVRQWSFVENRLLSGRLSDTELAALVIPMGQLASSLEMISNIQLSRRNYEEVAVALERLCPLLEVMPALAADMRFPSSATATATAAAAAAAASSSTSSSSSYSSSSSSAFSSSTSSSSSHSFDAIATATNSFVYPSYSLSQTSSSAAIDCFHLLKDIYRQIVKSTESRAFYDSLTTTVAQASSLLETSVDESNVRMRDKIRVIEEYAARLIREEGHGHDRHRSNSNSPVDIDSIELDSKSTKSNKNNNNNNNEYRSTSSSSESESEAEDEAERAHKKIQYIKSSSMQALVNDYLDEVRELEAANKMAFETHPWRQSILRRSSIYKQQKRVLSISQLIEKDTRKFLPADVHGMYALHAPQLSRLRWLLTSGTSTSSSAAAAAASGSSIDLPAEESKDTVIDDDIDEDYLTGNTFDLDVFNESSSIRSNKLYPSHQPFAIIASSSSSEIYAKQAYLDTLQAMFTIRFPAYNDDLTEIDLLSVYVARLGLCEDWEVFLLSFATATDEEIQHLLIHKMELYFQEFFYALVNSTTTIQTLFSEEYEFAKMCLGVMKQVVTEGIEFVTAEIASYQIATDIAEELNEILRLREVVVLSILQGKSINMEEFRRMLGKELSANWLEKDIDYRQLYRGTLLTTISQALVKNMIYLHSASTKSLATAAHVSRDGDGMLVDYPLYSAQYWLQQQQQHHAILSKHYGTGATATSIDFSVLDIYSSSSTIRKRSTKTKKEGATNINKRSKERLFVVDGNSKETNDIISNQFRSENIELDSSRASMPVLDSSNTVFVFVIGFLLGIYYIATSLYKRSERNSTNSRSSNRSHSKKQLSISSVVQSFGDLMGSVIDWVHHSIVHSKLVDSNISAISSASSSLRDVKESDTAVADSALMSSSSSNSSSQHNNNNNNNKRSSTSVASATTSAAAAAAAAVASGASTSGTSSIAVTTAKTAAADKDGHHLQQHHQQSNSVSKENSSSYNSNHQSLRDIPVIVTATSGNITESSNEFKIETVNQSGKQANIVADSTRRLSTNEVAAATATATAIASTISPSAASAASDADGWITSGSKASKATKAVSFPENLATVTTIAANPVDKKGTKKKPPTATASAASATVGSSAPIANSVTSTIATNSKQIKAPVAAVSASTQQTSAVSTVAIKVAPSTTTSALPQTTINNKPTELGKVTPKPATSNPPITTAIPSNSTASKHQKQPISTSTAPSLPAKLQPIPLQQQQIHTQPQSQHQSSAAKLSKVAATGASPAKAFDSSNNTSTVSTAFNTSTDTTSSAKQQTNTSKTDGMSLLATFPTATTTAAAAAGTAVSSSPWSTQDLGLGIGMNIGMGGLDMNMDINLGINMATSGMDWLFEETPRAVSNTPPPTSSPPPPPTSLLIPNLDHYSTPFDVGSSFGGLFNPLAMSEASSLTTGTSTSSSTLPAGVVISSNLQSMTPPPGPPPGLRRTPDDNVLFSSFGGSSSSAVASSSSTTTIAASSISQFDSFKSFLDLTDDSYLNGFAVTGSNASTSSASYIDSDDLDLTGILSGTLSDVIGFTTAPTVAETNNTSMLSHSSAVASKPFGSINSSNKQKDSSKGVGTSSSESVSHFDIDQYFKLSADAPEFSPSFDYSKMPVLNGAPVTAASNAVPFASSILPSSNATAAAASSSSTKQSASLPYIPPSRSRILSTTSSSSTVTGGGGSAHSSPSLTASTAAVSSIASLSLPSSDMSSSTDSALSALSLSTFNTPGKHGKEATPLSMTIASTPPSNASLSLSLHLTVCCSIIPPTQTNSLQITSNLLNNWNISNAVLMTRSSSNPSTWFTLLQLDVPMTTVYRSGNSTNSNTNSSNSSQFSFGVLEYRYMTSTVSGQIVSETGSVHSIDLDSAYSTFQKKIQKKKEAGLVVDEWAIKLEVEDTFDRGVMIKT